MKIRSYLRLALLCISVAVLAAPGSVLAIDYAKLYAEVSPAVVTVNTKTIKLSKSGISVAPGVGSGFLIEADLIVTAAHVVEKVDLVSVRFKDETEIKAEVIATAKGSDVALLRLEKPREDIVLAKMGDSDAASIGSPVFIVGAPYGIEQTLSVGYLSGRMTRGETAQGQPIEFLQTDTAINPGNSGGPMFNQNGEVIGIVSFILTKSGGFDGIGFAGAISPAYKTLIGSTEHQAGFKGLKLTRQQSRALSVPGKGVLIQRVVKGSSADELGLKAGTIPARIAKQDLLLGGDVILDIECSGCGDNEQSIDAGYLAEKISGQSAVSVKIFRNGEVMLLSSKPTQQQAPLPAAELAELSMLMTH